MAALRWAGPLPPAIASSLDRHRQVARLRSSVSGLPNQYLEGRQYIGMENFFPSGRHLLEKPTTGNSFGMGSLVQFAKVAVFGLRLDLRAERNDIEGGLLKALTGLAH